MRFTMVNFVYLYYTIVKGFYLSKLPSVTSTNMCLCHYASVTEKFLENIHTMLNEPSVGLYRMQEHVRRSLPQLVDKKVGCRMLICLHVASKKFNAFF